MISKTQDPNSFIFSFSSVSLPAHNAGGQILPLFIYPELADIFRNIMPGGSALIIRHCRMAQLDGVQTRLLVLRSPLELSGSFDVISMQKINNGACGRMMRN